MSQNFLKDSPKRLQECGQPPLHPQKHLTIERHLASRGYLHCIVDGLVSRCVTCITRGNLYRAESPAPGSQLRRHLGNTGASPQRCISASPNPSPPFPSRPTPVLISMRTFRNIVRPQQHSTPQYKRGNTVLGYSAVTQQHSTTPEVTSSKLPVPLP